MAGYSHEALARLLRPGSVAVVGASDKPGALGATLISNLDRAGFAGPIYPINPKRDRIGERACLADIADLPAGVRIRGVVPYGTVSEQRNQYQRAGRPDRQGHRPCPSAPGLPARPAGRARTGYGDHTSGTRNTPTRKNHPIKGSPSRQ